MLPAFAPMFIRFPLPARRILHFLFRVLFLQAIRILRPKYDSILFWPKRLWPAGLFWLSESSPAQSSRPLAEKHQQCFAHCTGRGLPCGNPLRPRTCAMKSTQERLPCVLIWFHPLFPPLPVRCLFTFRRWPSGSGRPCCPCKSNPMFLAVRSVSTVAVMLNENCQSPLLPRPFPVANRAFAVYHHPQNVKPHGLSIIAWICQTPSVCVSTFAARKGLPQSEGNTPGSAGCAEKPSGIIFPIQSAADRRPGHGCEPWLLLHRRKYRLLLQQRLLQSG